MSDADMSWSSLQEVFALGSPVLAIGPGCHRIGYDTTEEWQRVVQRAWLVWHRLESISRDDDETRARRDFLSHLWQSRLSSRARDWDGSVRTGPSVGSGAPPIDVLEKAVASRLAGEQPQVALATDLLCALVDATRALGDAVAAGSVPVIDWKLVRLPTSPSEAELLTRARSSLTAAAALAHDLAAVHSRRSPDLPMFRKHGLRRDEIDRKRLTVLKAPEIASALDRLVETCFGAAPSALSGAVVEWLSDLFWHVMVAGASVPFAQDELNFYLNLRGGDAAGIRSFSRPLPGEYRGRSGEIQPLRDDLSALLGNYDSGVAPDDACGAARDWTRPREAFARTMAATLLETWHADGHHRLAIGLVSDYDLMHERALMQLVREDQGFHVVCPVVTNPVKAEGEKATRTFEWLFGTYDGSDRTSVSKPTWQWLRNVPSMKVERPLGPVLLRLTGSPLFDLGRSLDQIAGEAPPDVTLIRPAVLFSEHESVQAILTLTRAHGGEQPPRGLYNELFGNKGLSWERRGWLFFGHRFADWLPRLQLLFTALMLGRQASPQQEQAASWPSPPDNSRVAISRRFDWPEEALLTALDIGRTRADLADVAHYYDIPTVHATGPQENSQMTRAFLGRVEARVEQATPPPSSAPSSGTSRSPSGQRRVFISYSQEAGEGGSDRWRDDVREFADLLNRRGIDTTLDQYDNHLNRDWTTWSVQQVADADIVVCLASPRYAEDWVRTTGSGAADEARALREELKRAERAGKAVIFVVLPGRSVDDIPRDMRAIHHVELDAIDREGIEDLALLLSGRAKFTKPKPEVIR